MEASGTFSAQSLGIEPQPIHLRVFAEDYFPGRKRVYSPNYVLYVLNAEQHAIWMTEQLNKWHRQALEVRDRELQLHETNKQLRDLPPEELDRPDVRRRIENQSAAERANGRRLTGLTAAGEDLLRQAARNPQFDVGSLDRWAEMLQILKDIAANRMPSVADLLDEAAKARAAGGKPAAAGPKAGLARGHRCGSRQTFLRRPARQEGGNAADPIVPAGRRHANPRCSRRARTPRRRPPARSRRLPSLRLPTTTLIGQAGDNPQSPQSPAGDKMEEAVRRQQDLLVEFEKIVNELNNILANLEGSTLVKRLKAASREQYRVAGRVGDLLEGSFGKDAGQIGASQKTVYVELSKVENTSSQNVSTIMDDLQAYFERRKFLKFKTVLDEMKSQDVVGGLRQIADELPERAGLVDRRVRILVGHHGPLGGGPGRSGVQRHVPVFRIAGQFAAGDRARSPEDPGRRSQSPRRNARGRAGAAGPGQGRIRQAGRRTVENAGRPGATREGRDRADPRIARCATRSSAAKSSCLARLPRSWTTRSKSSPAPRRARRRSAPRPKRSSSSCSRAASTRVAAAEEVRSPGGGGGGNTVDSALALLGIGVNAKEVRDAGHGNPSRRHFGAVASGRVPRRPGPILQPARKSGVPVVRTVNGPVVLPQMAGDREARTWHETCCTLQSRQLAGANRQTASRRH